MTRCDAQGPEPVHAGMLTEYMRHNLGQLLKPRGGRSDFEPQQPTLQTQLSGDDEVKASHTCSALPVLVLARGLYLFATSAVYCWVACA